MKHSYSVAERAFKIKLAADSIAKFSSCDFVISPEELNKYGTFNLRSIDTIFDLGYESAKKAIEPYRNENTD